MLVCELLGAQIAVVEKNDVRLGQFSFLNGRTPDRRSDVTPHSETQIGEYREKRDV
jgi:hypothetical protein